MVGLAMLTPGVEIVVPGWRCFGVLPVLGGVALHRSGTGRFRTAGTTVEPTGVPRVLVQEGVYAHTRNPMYLGGLAILTGAALLLGVATPVLLLPLYLLGSVRAFIRPEETLLEERFGESYRQYRSRVRRWL